jgi:DNA invertase Pin-like site-specific DNA recombinase
MGRRIAYRRVIGVDQKTDQQLDGMIFDKVFEGKISGSSIDCPKFNDMLRYIRPNQGDHIYVYEISTLGSSMLDLYLLIRVICKKGASLTFIKEKITFDPDLESRETKKAVFGMISVLDKFEHSLIKRKSDAQVTK